MSICMLTKHYIVYTYEAAMPSCVEEEEKMGVEYSCMHGCVYYSGLLQLNTTWP